MKYQVNVEGMHCMGCVNLIKMSLEDEGFWNVSVDLDNQKVSFGSEMGIEEVEESLQDIFSELSDYSFSDLQTLI